MDGGAGAAVRKRDGTGGAGANSPSEGIGGALHCCTARFVRACCRSRGKGCRASQDHEFCMSELRPGYRRTELGVIPEDWTCANLRSLGRIVRGGSPRPAGDPRYFNGSHLPWLTVAALTGLPDSQIYVRKTATS